MAKMVFDNVRLQNYGESDNAAHHASVGVVIEVTDKASIVVRSGNEEHLNLPTRNLVYCPLNATSVAVKSSCDNGCILHFGSAVECSKFSELLSSLAHESVSSQSVFDRRTEESSASQYFQFYGYLSQQQNMMQDYIRTATYQRAMISNIADFKDKVVLDVGAGSGILSFFAVQSGAKKVYAVEASSIAQHCELLVKQNGYGDKITVIAGKIEEISIPEPVDTIVSEPMGYMLINERMLESYLHAKKFLRPGGKVYPSRGDLHMSPFTDEGLYLEQCSKANFWCQEYFYGVNLSSLREHALKEYFRQPIVDTFDIRICVAKPQTHIIDFATANETDLHKIQIPLQFTIQQSALIHGLAFWFDVAFIGSSQTVWLSTSPTEPLTHWYQVRCLLQKPLLAKQGQIVIGKLTLCANKRQSYDVDLQLICDNEVSENTLDLKNPYFRYTGQIVQPPPGNNYTSPTDAYWNATAVPGEIVNGIPGALTNGSILANGNPAQNEYSLQQQPINGVVPIPGNYLNMLNQQQQVVGIQGQAKAGLPLLPQQQQAFLGTVGVGAYSHTVAQNVVYGDFGGAAGNNIPGTVMSPGHIPSSFSPAPM